MKTILQLFVIAVVTVLTGCGNHVGLHGKVTFVDNGEPVTDAEIRFSTPTFMARGAIQSDGSYHMGAYKKDDGLPPGTYDVTITRNVSPDGTQTGDPIDTKYAFRETSGLKATVDASTTVLNFSIDRISSNSNKK